MMNKNQVLISGCIICKETGTKTLWFITKASESEKWEFPKVTVRKGESSVRAVLRMISERGEMATRVLEEAGRTNETTTQNTRTIQQRTIYYLMLAKTVSKEAIGFENFQWVDYSQASKKLGTKKEREMLKEAKEIYKKWKKERLARKKRV